MATVCTQCSRPFEIAEREMEFLSRHSPAVGATRFSIPSPDSCYDCRRKQLLTWRNERSIYERKSNCCGETIVSMYRPETPFTVFCHDCFWSDKWDPHRVGRDFDFSKTFFEQFQDLLRDAPLIALINTHTENSPHCHRIHDGKNNYMSHIALDGPEDLIHTHYTMGSKRSADIIYSHHCEDCYEMVDAENCIRCFYSNRIRNCNDCYFCQDCISCKNCFGCKNLFDKEYCIYNEQYSKEEFHQFLKRARLDSYLSVQEHRRRAARFFLTHPSQAVISRNCVNVSGTNVYDCTNCEQTYDFHESHDLLYCTFGECCVDCVSGYGIGHAERCYESVGLLNTTDTFFTATAARSSNLYYCYECYEESSNLFGCIGLKNTRHCVLNKRYSEDEYNELVPRIIKHMEETGEWGKFFPADISPFAYNETVAMNCFPIKRETALRGGISWYTSPIEPSANNWTINAEELADSITEIPDEIVSWTILGAENGRAFRIIPEELAFYRKFGIPLPRKHFDERHRDREAQRNAHRLWHRKCEQCKRDMLSTYHTERPEIVFCDECYNETVLYSSESDNQSGPGVANLY